ncbi:MAG: DinB family protein [Alphaproteobacteria bacterium]|nr:DinB family protein [Alphaproteobacteria bacterium]
MFKPDVQDQPVFFQKYIDLVHLKQVHDIEKKYFPNIIDFWASIPPEKYFYKYAPEKWRTVDILRHLIDCHRVFMYRLLRIVRLDAQNLTSFNQDIFAQTVATSPINYTECLNELSSLFKADACFLKALHENDLHKLGHYSNGTSLKANSLLHIMIGHCIHHQNIYQERYL